MEESNHRIAYALHMKKKWIYGKDNEELLHENGIQVTPEEFDLSMKGMIFCPVCATPLSRSPDTSSVSTNSRTAHFKHKPTYSKISCRLKTKRMEGLSYKNEEEAFKSIEDQTLVIVSDWMAHPPSNHDDIDETGEFNQTAIEDANGPETEVAIGRHRGREFNLPSKISSVTALCKEFDKNLHKGYHLPDSQFPMLLSDMLFNINRITENTDSKNRLFFGKISGYKKLNKRNIIYIKIEGFNEFKLYSWPEFDKRKHINTNSIGRHILFHSSLEWEGNIPRCFVNSWGQYSLLPQKYEKLLNHHN
ncbi:MAG: hypothetical protein C9355_06045 [Thalassolituus maritimus]|uniref:Uncharacterized protein n=1 Tax=Thalassolituus maritimus TaxID=484498 RepID=A0A1N7IYG9_9GAMM|nr:hypothetical protein [Thalassolituus maritimus]TPD54899.1 MAG: hypothetical protein C9355_06045 [Thalassolituus maritimus]SIS42036.1 hypothetical protein SAMN05421686_101137 [Thalassolituus maritimus]